LGTFIGIILFSRKPSPFYLHADKWKGAEVLKVSNDLGSYGMGGCGFLGMKIRLHSASKWLVFLLWGASGWLTLDKRIFKEDLFPDERKLCPSHLLSSTEDLIGLTLSELNYDHDSLSLTFNKGDSVHILTLRRDGRDVRRWRGTGGRKSFEDHEKLEDSLVICDTSNIWS